MDKGYDRTYVEVNLQAIRHNILEARHCIQEGTKVMAIVKADAYGHGAIPVAKALYDIVDAYGVAMIEEAMELRKTGVDKLILILGYTGECWYEELVRHHISQTIYTYDMAKKLSDVAVSMGVRTPIHIKLDTGMGRIGFSPDEESVQIVKQISKLPGVEIEGIFTHFARADEKTIEPAREPFARYQNFVDLVEKCGIHIPIKHVCNSASIMAFPEANLDMVRSGITTYGLYPSEEVDKSRMQLQPAMQWKTIVSYVKTIQPGTSISYGGTFTADREMRVATIPVGYADGMKRDLSGKGHVLIKGQYAPILGRICMDQFMVDVTDISNVTMGEEVVIFGEQGGQNISVEEISGMAHSFNYEFVCGISHRVPRRYI